MSLAAQPPGLWQRQLLSRAAPALESLYTRHTCHTTRDRTELSLHVQQVVSQLPSMQHLAKLCLLFKGVPSVLLPASVQLPPLLRKLTLIFHAYGTLETCDLGALLSFQGRLHVEYSIASSSSSGPHGDSSHSLALGQEQERILIALQGLQCIHDLKFVQTKT